MTAKGSNKKPQSSKPESVEEFLALLDNRSKDEVLAIREIILAADPSITEGIKWNVPSFRTTEYFATIAKDRAVVAFRGLNDITARRSAFTKLIREWIKHV